MVLCMSNNKKVLFMTVGSGVIARNMLVLPDSVLMQAKKQFSKIVLLVPESARKQIKKDYEKENVTVEALKTYTDEDGNWYQQTFTFVCNYLIFTPGMRMFAWSAALRSTSPIGGGKRYLYPIKLFIYYTLVCSSSTR